MQKAAQPARLLATRSAGRRGTFQQHVDTGGLRSSPPHPRRSVRWPTGASPNSPPAASPACKEVGTLLSVRRDPALPAGSSPCQPVGRGPRAQAQPSGQPAGPRPAPAPWGPGLPNSPSSSSGGVCSEPASPPLRSRPPGGGARALAAPPPNSADLLFRTCYVVVFSWRCPASTL